MLAIVPARDYPRTTVAEPQAQAAQGPYGDDQLIGRAVGNYRVTRVIGEGGMGRVYEAIHPVMGRKVAVKVLLQEFCQHKEVVSRFFTEARAAHEIHHPNIVDVLDLGHLDSGVPYIVMELLDGKPMSSVLQDSGVFNPQRVARLAADCARALAAAHAHGVIHRDLKPDNIFLVPGPGEGSVGEKIKILDFGVAKLTSDSATSATHKTMAGTLIGTPFYMSPEQCQGRADIDHRTDVYALGAIMYEILTGRPPFMGQSFGEILIAHSTQPPQPPSQLRAGLAPGLEAIVLRCLEKSPANRYASMEDLGGALDQWMANAGPVGGVTGTTGQHDLSKMALDSTSMLTPSQIATSASSPSLEVATGPGAPSSAGVGAASAPGLTGFQVSTPPKSRAGLVVGSLLALGIVGGAVWFAMTKQPPPPPPPVVEQPPPPPVAPKLVDVVVTTDPPQARIIDVASGKQIGVSPTKVAVKKGDKIAVRLEREGYAPFEKVLDPDVQDVVQATLIKLPSNDPIPTVQPKGKRPKGKVPVAGKQETDKPEKKTDKPKIRDEIEKPSWVD